MSRDLATIRNALTDEDEIAHGEAWNPVTSDLMGICAYCNADWPCRTQRGIERLLALLADTPSVEPPDGAAVQRQARLRDALNDVVGKSTWRPDNTVLIHDGTAWNTLVGRIVMATNGDDASEPST